MLQFCNCFGMHYLFYKHDDEDKGGGCFTLFVFLISCISLCSVAFPYSVIGWFAVCDCNICILTYLMAKYLLDLKNLSGN